MEPERSSWSAAARLWMVVLAFLDVAELRSIQVGVPFRDPRGRPWPDDSD